MVLLLPPIHIPVELHDYIIDFNAPLTLVEFHLNQRGQLPKPLTRLPHDLSSHADESTHLILSYGLLFLIFYRFPYTAGPPISTTLMRPSPTFARRFVRSLPTILYTHRTIGPVPCQRPLI